MQSVDLSTYVPEFTVSLNGEIDAGIRNSATSVSVNEKLGEASEFTLVLADKFDAQKQKFIWLEKFLSQDSPLYDDKKKIAISIGYAKKLKNIIAANLKSVSTSGFTSNITQITLTGFDASHKVLTNMSPGKSEKTIEIEKDDTYSDIAEKLADSVGLEKEIDPTKKYRPVTIKKNVTYLEFLKDAAKRVGYEFFISRGILYFIDPRKERKLKSQEQNHVFKWGQNIQEFVPVINIANLVPEVEVRGHPPNSRKLVVQTASSGSEDVVEQGNTTGSQVAKKLNYEKKLITDRHFDTKEEASDIAKAELNIIGDELITASCSLVGDNDLSPGQYVVIEGVGVQLSGKYLVTGATHTIDGNGYNTKIDLRRNCINIKI